MTWAKFDDASWSHPKTLRVGNEAWGAFVRMVCYCAQHLTDGVLDGDTALAIAGRQKVIDKLVSAGLLEHVGDAIRVHDYLERNPSRAQVEAEREAKTQRQNRWRESRGRASESAQNARKTARVDASTTPSQDASQHTSRDGSGDDAPSRPVPTRMHPSDAARDASADPQPTTSGGEAIDVLNEITRGAALGARPGAWDHRGDARTVGAFVRALEGLQRSKEELRTLGQYLASPEAEETLKSKRFAPRSFVFLSTDGADASRVERACMLAAEWAAKREPAQGQRPAPVVRGRPKEVASPEAARSARERIRRGREERDRQRAIDEDEQRTKEAANG